MQGVGLWASKATKGQTSGDALQSTLDRVVRPAAAAACLSARVHHGANDTGDSTDSQALLGAPAELGGRVCGAKTTSFTDAKICTTPFTDAKRPPEATLLTDPNTSVTAPGTMTSLADPPSACVHHADEIRGHGEKERAHTINVLLAHPIVMRAMQNPRLDAILTHARGLMLFLNPQP